MIFDPFKDFETRGYLRNFEAEKDLASIKIIENRSFLAQLETALKQLSRIETLSYADVLNTHKTLFGNVYPWAGHDRAATTPNLAITRGEVVFAHPNDARRSVEYALELGQDRSFMAAKPGEVMGYLAYGHPFLDGNGRTIMTVHTELAQRAGIGIDWGATEKAAYLTALTQEIDSPGQGYLDAYLKPFIGAALGHENLAAHITGIRGFEIEPRNEGQAQIAPDGEAGKIDRVAEFLKTEQIDRATEKAALQELSEAVGAVAAAPQDRGHGGGQSR